MTTPNRSLALLVFACAGALASPAELMAEEVNYEMTSYLGGPGGTQLLNGDYETAITAASRTRARDVTDSLAAATHLCVAYTATQALSRADEACDKALKIAKRVDRTRYSGARRATETAKALSNRGVLRAVSGDTTDAASDFRQAADMSRGWKTPTHNLAQLERSPAFVLGMVRSD